MRLARRIFWMRSLGLGLGALCVAAVLRLNGGGVGWWIALGLHAFVWPPLALQWSLRSGDPKRTETRNLLIDSALGGIWVAAMQFNVLPSVLLVTMLTVDKVGPRHVRALVKSLALLVATCLATALLLGFPVNFATPMSVVVACLPLLVVYPLATNAIATALAHRVADQNRLLEEMGRTDPLTGLANRRKVIDVADAEFARFRRSDRPATLLILDIDHFKAINDEHGHLAGDYVLSQLAVVLRDETRAVDTAARYGGDEFMIILPETSLAGGLEFARRVRERVADQVAADTPGVRWTVSIGAAETNHGLPDVDAWIHAADQALYRAKALGRDRYVGADPGTAPSATPAASGDDSGSSAARGR